MPQSRLSFARNGAAPSTLRVANEPGDCHFIRFRRYFDEDGHHSDAPRFHQWLPRHDAFNSRAILRQSSLTFVVPPLQRVLLDAAS